MLTPQIYLLNKGRSHFHKVMHLFSTNCKNCTGVGSQNSSVELGNFVLETNERLSKSEPLKKKNPKKIRIILF